MKAPLALLSGAFVVPFRYKSRNETGGTHSGGLPQQTKIEANIEAKEKIEAKLKQDGPSGEQQWGMRDVQNQYQ